MLDYGYMAPTMFAGLVIFLLIGFPVAFSLAALGLFFGFLAIEVGYFGPEFLKALPYERPPDETPNTVKERVPRKDP